MAPIDRKRKRTTDGDEEAAFPRGGASLLTPLEHKQIQIEATRDVLFEQQSSKSSKKVENGGEREISARKRPKTKQKGKSTSDVDFPFCFVFGRFRAEISLSPPFSTFFEDFELCCSNNTSRVASIWICLCSRGVKRLAPPLGNAASSSPSVVRFLFLSIGAIFKINLANWS